MTIKGGFGHRACSNHHERDLLLPSIAECKSYSLLNLYSFLSLCDLSIVCSGRRENWQVIPSLNDSLI